MTIDMTKGSVTKQIIRFSIPVFLGSLFQQVYNLADTIIVGRLLGVNALAGVGSTTGLWFLVFSVCNGFCNGFSVSVSQKFGTKDEDGLKNILEMRSVLQSFPHCFLLSYPCCLQYRY